MSTKSNRSTTSTKNSFGILSMLEDSQDLKTPKKSSVQKTVESAPKPSVPVVQITKPAAAATSSNSNGGANSKKDKKNKQINKETTAKAAAGASITPKVSKSSTSAQSYRITLLH